MVKYDTELSDAFGALADGTRRRMVERLVQEGPLSISELATPFPISLPAVSKHLKILKEARLVRCEKEGRVTRCTVQKEPLSKTIDWLTAQEAYWNSSLSRLEKLITKNKSK